MNGQQVDGGVYEVRGDVLTSRSGVTGVVEQYRIRLQGDTLTMTAPNGASVVYRRVRR